MGLTAPSSTRKGFEAGIYDAVCYSVLDIGTQENKFGKKHQIVLGWKFLEFTYEDGNPVSYHATYTLSMNEKARLREILAGWVLQGNKNPEAFDFQNLLGLGCKLILAPNSNGNITAKSAMPMEVKDNQKIETEFFSFEDYDGGELPSFLKTERNKWKLDRICDSEEYKGIVEKNEDHKVDNMNNDVKDEEIPF